MESLDEHRARKALWLSGDLRWKYHTGQEELDDFVIDLEKRKKKKGTIRTARRFGKTYFLEGFAASKCLTQEKILIPYLAPTVKSLKTIIIPIFHEIFRDCPRNLVPHFRKQDGIFEFHNGSQIILAGTDGGNAEKLRGIKADYAILDESAFMDDLQYIVNDILIPALMFGNGFILSSSTPPPAIDHYFVTMLEETEGEDCSFHRTVWDNPRLTNEDILNFAVSVNCKVDWTRLTDQQDRAIGRRCIVEKSITFRREFEAEIVADPERKIIPEFNQETEPLIVKEIKEHPEYRHKYTVIDTGFIDFTGVVFGYWDFARAKVVIERDLKIDFKGEGMTAKLLAERILQVEKELWGDDKPFLRFADGDQIVLHELTKLGLTVQLPRKDNLEAQINQCRLDLVKNQLEIDPKASNLIAQLRYGIWNKRRTDFERTKENGHFDVLMALIYFLRHINRTTNPMPKGYNTNVYTQHIPDKYYESDAARELSKIFGRKDK